MQNIIFEYFSWHFIEMPVNILKAWWNFILFSLNYFSVSLLLKTFLAPWRRDVLVFPRGFDLGKYLEILFSNLISRVLGAIVRSVLIVLGIIVEIFVILFGIIVFIGWMILPLIIIFGFMLGFRNLFL